MADIYSKSKRSEVMSLVRGQGNVATEVAMVALLRRHRIIGWRRHRPLFGNPDFIFPTARLAMFVDGCFWHCCPKHASQPKSNGTSWQRKLSRNKARDREVNRTLRASGWRVVRVWQHDLKRRNETRLVHRIRQALGLATQGSAE